jgi:hypothetical protein
MGLQRTLASTAFTAAVLVSAAAGAQTASGTPNAETTQPIQPSQLSQPAKPIANAYRGTMVCERAAAAVDILRVPMDVAIRGDNVQFARPLFNLQGTRVLGSELGNGSIDQSGNVHATSIWRFRGIVAHGDYSGTLTPSGGTLRGTQTWHTAAGPGSRMCYVALAPTPYERAQLEQR